MRLLAVLAVLAAAPGLAVARDAGITSAPAAVAPVGDLSGADVAVVLRDGQVLRGRLVARDATTVTIDVAGTRMVLPASAVSDVSLAPGPREAPLTDPGRTRYLYSPSAFFLRQGEGYVSQTELLITSVAVGATDWLTLQAGTVIPVAFFDPTQLPFVLAVKAGGHVAGPLHLAAGLQTLVIPGISEAPAVGFLFATATLGDEDRHVSVSAGPPFLLSKGTSDLGPVLVSVSGAARVTRWLALVSENWLLPVDGRTELVGSGALRFIAERLTVDAGLVFFHGADVPVPWLDFSWHWR